MIIKEYLMTRKDGVEIYKRYSDQNKYILQRETGILFESASDIEPCKYTYIESDEDIKIEEVEQVEIEEKESENISE